ncbi:hypothetical protein DUNSADRAFT_9573 [Dunaliella salina]|nr:hypothetical protein DUNSADRAFT_9573 [Dunaliella salina]|eukprot:KAF5833913.1 hypothetical protein DUNSADRAFT_9573 [Dunaliella salina]
MQFHGGLRVYYSLLRNAWRSIKDFAFWFIYVMMVFGSIVIMVFQISGGNERFAIRWEGINSMALVTFGYMDYETFTNQVAGVGGWGPIIIAIFWLAVAILGTVAMNILIAIVGDAYTEAKDKEGPIEFTFVYICWLRIVWTLIYVRQIWFSWMTEEEFVAYWVSIVVNEFNTDSLSATHDFRASRKNPLFTMRISRLFARWGLVLLPEVKTLLTYFSDASNTMLCDRSPWEDGEAVEEMLTDMSCHKRRQRVTASKHEWTIDTAMSHSTFMMFMMAFGGSGTCGLPQGLGDDIEDISLPSEAKAKRDVENPVQDVAAWREVPLNYSQFKILADKKLPEQLEKAEAYWFTKSPALYDAYCKGTLDETQWQEEVTASCLAEVGAEGAGALAAPDELATAKPFALHETCAEFLYQKAMAPLTEVLCPRKTAALQVLEAFGASSNKMSGLWLLGFRKQRLRWSQEKILRYASWIWEVYATEQLGDEEWAAEMDDVDYKLLELKEWFVSEMEKRVAPARPSALSTRPSGVSRVPSRFGGNKRPSSAASTK